MSGNIFEVMLDSFHRSAIDESPIEIMKNFLRFVIRDGALSQSGSILLYNKSKDALELFNPDDFLFKEKFLQPGQDWAREMPSSQGLAGSIPEGGLSAKTFPRIHVTRRRSPIRPSAR